MGFSACLDVLLWGRHRQGTVKEHAFRLHLLLCTLEKQQSDSITVWISVFNDMANIKPELNQYIQNGRDVTTSRYFSKHLLRLNAECTSERGFSINVVDHSALNSSIICSYKSETKVRSFCRHYCRHSVADPYFINNFLIFFHPVTTSDLYSTNTSCRYLYSGNLRNRSQYLTDWRDPLMDRGNTWGYLDTLKQFHET